MVLTLQCETIGEVVVIRCQGRIVVGDEAKTLQLELERRARETKYMVLQLAEVNFIDSGGLGVLVRHFGILRNTGRELKLCELSPFLLQVLQATKLLPVFQIYASEKEAIEAFAERSLHPRDSFDVAAARVVCIDTSKDLLAYLGALLKRSGYQTLTTTFPSDAITLVGKHGVLIVGPGTQTNGLALERFRQIGPNVQLLLLPSDFSTAEASQAGLQLVDRLRPLLQIPQ
jgi:anti-anti-sigma factor